MSCPDLAFNNVVMICKPGRATQGDMQAAVKIVKKLKMQTTVMKFPNLGEVKGWSIDGFGDLAIKAYQIKSQVVEEE